MIAFTDPPRTTLDDLMEPTSRVTGPIDPVQIDIRHHHNGQTRVSARGGRGTKLGIRSGPTMQPS